MVTMVMMIMMMMMMMMNDDEWLYTEAIALPVEQSVEWIFLEDSQHGQHGIHSDHSANHTWPALEVLNSYPAHDFGDSLVPHLITYMTYQRV